VDGIIINEKDISNILYSNIRNEKHRYTRIKGYRRHIIKLLYLFLAGGTRVDISKKRESILNFVPDKFYNLDGLSSQFNIINSKYAATNRWMILIEILLTAAFLIRRINIQKFLLNTSRKILVILMRKHNLEYMICAHPDLLCSFIGFVFKKTDRKVITIQHGIYQLSSYEILWFEKCLCSHIVVWGQLFKDLYVAQGVDSAKVMIGAACLTHKEDNGIHSQDEVKTIKPVIIGQQLNKVSNSVFTSYNSFISKLIQFYIEKDIGLNYRPHPRENIKDTLTEENIKNLIILENIDQAEFISRYNIFYSVISTLLVETFLNRKLSYQMSVEIDEFKYDEYRNYTGIPFIYESDISNHLNVASYSFAYDTRYVNLTKSYRQYNQDCIRQSILISNIGNT